MRLIVVRIGSIIQVTEQQRSELGSIVQSRSLPAGYVFRAKLILMLSEGATFATIRERLGTTNPTILRWKERFLAEGKGLLELRHQEWCGPDAWGTGYVEIEVRQPVVKHKILLKNLRTWLEQTSGGPKYRAQRQRLKEMLEA
jgi:Homeodomain-like domain